MTNRILQWANDLGRTPVAPLLGHPGAPLTGTTLKANLTDPATQTASLKALEEAVSPDALFLFMDLTVEAEALGCSIEFDDNAPPSVEHSPITDASKLGDLDTSQDLPGRMSTFVEVVRQARDTLDTPISAYTIGPFTLASQLAGTTNLCVSCIKDPDFVKRLVEQSTEVIKQYAAALVEAGVEVYTILEPSAVMISAQHFGKFSGPYCRELFDSVPQAWKILHICGNSGHLLEAMCATGAEGLSLDANVSLPELARRCPGDVALIGNISPVQTVMQKDPAAIRTAVLDLRKEMAEHPNFVLSTGCDLPLGTPMENVKAFVEAGKEPL
ncbi:MAG: uroporphyrinogen decarboxylase family protein [Synergistales bacterium]|nr:uroporphyrinogen decarboxylase family protein [Synergistales bacterium]